MKKLIMKINVLGAEYKVFTATPSDIELLQRCDGCILPELKTIYLDVKNKPQHQNNVLSHELVHAFLYESGLDNESWAGNEEIVDWIAIQTLKITSTIKNGIKMMNHKENKNVKARK